MKKFMFILVALIGFGINAYSQRLTSDELKRLHDKNPNAVRVYQDRVNELENIIIKANENIEWLKTELKMNVGEHPAANSQIHKRIEQEEEKIKKAKQDLESAYRHYRSLVPKKEEEQKTNGQ